MRSLPDWAAAPAGANHHATAPRRSTARVMRRGVTGGHGRRVVATVRGVDGSVDVRGAALAVPDEGSAEPSLLPHRRTRSREREDESRLIDWRSSVPDVRLVRFLDRGHGSSEATAKVAGYRWYELGADYLALAVAHG